MTKGLIIGGDFGSILIRQKSTSSLEMGELLMGKTATGHILMQITDLLYGSQLTQQHLELVSGLKLEEDASLELMDASLRTYTLAKLKSLAHISPQGAKTTKELPTFFTDVRDVTPSDLQFITSPPHALELGKLRSGSKVLEVPCAVDGRKAFSHHLLIAGTTGRGKSVLMTNMLWNMLDKMYCGLLVLDPHNEYYDRLTSHSAAQQLLYYTPSNPPPGGRTLRVHLSLITPRHFNGVINWSDAQRQALNAYYARYGKGWVEAALREKELPGFHEGTLAVVKRILMQLLRIRIDQQGTLQCDGVFDTHAGQTTVHDVTSALATGKTVVIDTSTFHGSAELLIGSMIANHVLEHQKSKTLHELRDAPVINIVLEEAPRVLGKDVLERGSNVFATIAREGRKFNVGLTAITQLPSLIPREVLANMNTKIILGIELRPERTAIIESAAQDLSADDRMIASLDKGEAIVTSNFLRFAMPIKIPLRQQEQQQAQKTSFSGMQMR